MAPASSHGAAPTRLTRRRCDTLGIDTTRAYGEVNLVLPLTDSHGALLLSDGTSLRVQYRQWVATRSAVLGANVGGNNRAILVSTPGLHTVFVGSQQSVHRVELADDVLHSDGFEP